MDYNKFLNAEDIPTIRRLDYIVKDTDGFESGKLYAALRNMIFLNKYCSREYNEEEKEAYFSFDKKTTVPKLEWVNQWMEAHNKEGIFTNPNNWKKVGEDYDYFWNLRTEQQFIKEEAEARLGINGRKPLKDAEKYNEQIEQLVEKIQEGQEAPSLEE